MKVPKARRLPAGMWYIQLRLGGESIVIKARTEKECIRQAQLYKSEYLAGKRQLPSEKLPTLKEACKSYLQSRPLSPATLRSYQSMIDNRLQCLMNCSISDLTGDDYQKAILEESKAGARAKTLRNVWGLISSVIRSVGAEPPRISLPHLIPNEIPFLEPSEITTFQAATKGQPYEVPMLLALSGLRCSEIMGLTWDKIDLQRRVIRVQGAIVRGSDGWVRKDENKNRSSTRNVPIMMDQLYRALKAAQQPSGPVVTCTPNTLLRAVHRTCKEAGITEVGIHGLRHSFASLAYHLNVPEKDTMEIGGWADDRTMRRVYTHVAKSDVDHYVKHFTAFFDGPSAENAK